MESAGTENRAGRAFGAQSDRLTGSGKPQVSYKGAKLFPDLFRNIDPEKRLRVLEIGRAQGPTVDFFSAYKCRLRFADLYTKESLLNDQAGQTEAELSVAFRKALDIPKGEKFDLCLFWDIMQFLSGRSIRALCGALEAHIHKETRAHGFGVHSILTTCERAEYSVASLNEFRVRKGGLPDLQYLPHPQAELSELLTVFKIDRAILMGDGTVEMLLGSKPYWD